MSVAYQAVGWNRHKKIYDVVVVAGRLAFLGMFVGVSLATQPAITAASTARANSPNENFMRGIFQHVPSPRHSPRDWFAARAPRNAWQMRVVIHRESRNSAPE